MCSSAPPSTPSPNDLTWQVLLATLRCPAGSLLTDRDVCNIMNTCFRVLHQATHKNHLLHRLAGHTLLEMVRDIFSQLPDLPGTSLEDDLLEAAVTEGTMRMLEREEGEAEEGGGNTQEGAGDATALSSQGRGADEGRGSAREAHDGTGGVAAGGADGTLLEYGEHARSRVEEGANKSRGSLIPRQLSGGVDGNRIAGGSVIELGATGGGVVAMGGDGEAYATHGYGIGCAVELFHFLCALLTMEEQQRQQKRQQQQQQQQSSLFATSASTGGSGSATDLETDVTALSLSLLSAAVELGGTSMARHPRLLGLVQDDLMRCLMQLGLSANRIIMAQVSGLLHCRGSV